MPPGCVFTAPGHGSAEPASPASSSVNSKFGNGVLLRCTLRDPGTGLQTGLPAGAWPSARFAARHQVHCVQRLELAVDNVARRVRRGGAGGGTRTPTGIAALRIFLPATAFAALAPPVTRGRVCGLDYPFTVLGRAGGPCLRVGAARLVSTPSPSGPAQHCAVRGLAHRGLGSGLPLEKVSPSLGSSASGVSLGALKSCLKSVASTGFATPA